MSDKFKKFKDSTGNFKYAIEGIVHVYRSQKHMRFHMLALIICGIFSLILKLNYIEVLFIVFSITQVIVTEMINTAVEAVVDLFTQSYHPLAKFAKDIAAGATLIAALNALIVIVVIVLYGGNVSVFGISAERSYLCTVIQKKEWRRIV